jgi:hypothetical protein
VPDWGVVAQRAAEQRLAYCWYLLAVSEGEVEEGDFDGPISDPYGVFCGCETCCIREALDAAYQTLPPHMREELERTSEE